MTSKENQKRYQLHYRSRKLGFKLNTKERTFYVKKNTKELPRPVSRLKEEFGYAIQLEIC